MCLEGLSAIAWSRKPVCTSIHSLDYVFMVLVSVFISKTHNHFYISAISAL